jgi:hypothetical protein
VFSHESAASNFIVSRSLGGIAWSFSGTGRHGDFLMFSVATFSILNIFDLCVQHGRSTVCQAAMPDITRVNFSEESGRFVFDFF